MSANGRSRHFAAQQILVAIGGMADIDQAAPIKLDLCVRALDSGSHDRRILSFQG
jgi:hypothetical protein